MLIIPGHPSARRETEEGGERRPAAFGHHAVLCAGPPEMALRAAEVVDRAVREQRAVVAVLRPDVEEVVRRHMGAVADRVRFLPHAQVYARNIDASHRRQVALLEGVIAREGPTTAIAQHDPEPDEDPWGVRCLESEVRAGMDFAGLPLQQYCLYREDRHPRLLGIARRTHPLVTGPAGESASRFYRDPRAAAADHPALCHLDEDATVHEVRPEGDPGVRRWLSSTAQGVGLVDPTARDFAAAAHEALRAVARHLIPRRSAAPTVRTHLHETPDRLMFDVDSPLLARSSPRRLPDDPRLRFLWLAARNRSGVTVRQYVLDGHRSLLRVAVAR